MKIFIGTDHAGFELKNQLLGHLADKGCEVIDAGPFTFEKTDDYPDYAYQVATKVIGEADEDQTRGILICTSGQGMAIAANRVPGIRAALAWDKESAKHSRQHNNANVLSLPGKRLSYEQAVEVIDAWLDEKFTKEERHIRRLGKIDNLG